jgi:lipoprotein-releasing system ATP-binding protein
LLADEPTGNLDFRTGEMIISILQDLHRSHKLTSIYVTHNLSFATRCDRILQLDKGDLTRWSGASQSEEGIAALSSGPGTSDNVEGRR